jgi:hypothetical protein
LVTVVGSENVGILRSTRSLSGATGTLPGSAGCGIACPDEAAPAREAAGELESELEHPLTSNITTAITASSRARI